MAGIPNLRITRQGQDRPQGAAVRPLTQVVTRRGQAWAGRVPCFATRDRQLDGTLLARWDAPDRDPWLIVTDLPPAADEVAWYGLRAWIACGDKDSQRGGWHWEQTKLRDPRRAERWWLAMAVATLWTVSVGCQAEVALPVPLLTDLPEPRVARRHATHQRPSRALSCFRRGRLVIVAALGAGQPVPLGRLVPEPWPKSLDTHAQCPAEQTPLWKAA